MSDIRHSTADCAPSRVLLVEPEPLAREVITGTLDAAGLVVDSASTLQAEIDVLVSPPAILVAEADLATGGVDGLALAGEARQRWPNLGVVFITGRPLSRLDGHVLGRRDRFVVRPVAPLAVVRAVRGLLSAVPSRRTAA